ncbi:bifunctional folylpolyglutamate synthase/dihydrofolate synthase [Peptoniphilus equinus]|uniref:tetrahydrofolate synthase n=1 Tax=Peptoniphilus equinus TaxID=3016343 RepID=A0ABY7QU47_9FIRM|nr:folylpolyglutamate synthase/dihydrofolate synthase family protein [Peptoniphilus equinus]WBW50297.1 bifunctional folylpolyglutamate synthase/dihydrofolate synthase [Peptoniphilus equinus]
MKTSKRTTFNDYLDWMYDRGSSGEKHTLNNVRKLLAHFDNPQDKIKVIHVAGTNGKGSTCHYMAAALSQTARTGMFISPYMESILESISINGEWIAESEFRRYVDELAPIVEQLDAEGYHNTYFEVLTAIMYRYFYDQKVDVAVVEVGMGGLVDSTNLIKSPLASVICTIALDHVAILGNTLEAVAKQKGGIIKEGRPVYVYPNKPEVMATLRAIADEKHAPFHTFTKEDVVVKSLTPTENHFAFRDYPDVTTHLVGVHQLYNCALALTVLHDFKDQFGLDDAAMLQAIEGTKNEGRLEFIHQNPTVLIDGSHNAEAIDVLLESLKAFTYNRLILGFSILKDKDYNHVIDALAPLADEIVLTTIDNPRAFTLDELKEEMTRHGANFTAIADRIEAYEYSKSLAEEGDLVLWCGSLYLIREFRNYELSHNHH